MLRAAEQGLARRGERLRDLSRALPRPETLLTQSRQRLDSAERALPAALTSGTMRHRDRFATASGALRPMALSARIANERASLSRLSARLEPAVGRLIARQGDRLTAADRLRESLGYQATLGRGYALVRADGVLAPDKVSAAASDALEIEFRDGRLSVGAAQEVRAPKKSKAHKAKGSQQGSLF